MLLAFNRFYALYTVNVEYIKKIRFRPLKNKIKGFWNVRPCCWVNGFDVPKDLNDFYLQGQAAKGSVSATLLGRLNFDDEGTTILRKDGKYLPKTQRYIP
jgi:hypothetical protein